MIANASVSTIRTLPKPNCLLCGEPGTILHSNLRDRLFSAPGIWHVKQCMQQSCGLIWLDPSPLPEDLGLAYQSYYTHTQTAPGTLAIIYKVCKSAYSAVIEAPCLLTGLSIERRRFVRMLLGNIAPGRLLDVGCGDGAFLHLMAQAGWHCLGIDFDAAAIESGQKKYGLDLRVADFQAAQFDGGGFDAITMRHVIEHVPDPFACLDKCRRLLKPHGRLVLTTPNARSLGHKKFGGNWRGLEPPRHLYIFSPALLRECARRVGLEIVQTGSTAVNADYFSNTSLAIERASTTTGGTAHARMRYAHSAVAFQQREHLMLRRNPDLGEEAFLVADRNDSA